MTHESYMYHKTAFKLAIPPPPPPIIQTLMAFGTKGHKKDKFKGVCWFN